MRFLAWALMILIWIVLSPVYVAVFLWSQINGRPPIQRR